MRVISGGGKMRYIGSKASCVSSVYRLLRKYGPHQSICDPFGGIGTVGSFFRRQGLDVWTGDILRFAHYFQIARIERRDGPYFRRLQQDGFGSANAVVQHLQSMGGQDGWLVDNYAEERLFFQQDNARRIQACWNEILRWDEEGLLTRLDRAVLMASLIESFDRVANTAGTYYAHLKDWYRKAKKPFEFNLIPAIPGGGSGRASLSDAQELVSSRDFDLIYLDPPHSARQYARYYHLPESVARGRRPEVSGKSGTPDEPYRLSPFCRKSTAAGAMEALVDKCRAPTIAVHYSRTGLIAEEEMVDILHQVGPVQIHDIGATGYTSTPGSRETEHRLYVVSNG